MYMVDHSRIQSLYGELHEDNETNDGADSGVKRKCKYYFIRYSTFNSDIDIIHMNLIFSFIFQVISIQKTRVIAKHLEL